MTYSDVYNKFIMKHIIRSNKKNLKVLIIKEWFAFERFFNTFTEWYQGYFIEIHLNANLLFILTFFFCFRYSIDFYLSYNLHSNFVNPLIQKQVMDKFLFPNLKVIKTRNSEILADLLHWQPGNMATQVIKLKYHKI